MRKTAGIVFWALLWAVTASAQETPKAEIFGGYSYFHAGAGNNMNASNLNGWNAAVTGNVNSWLGVTAEFSGHYGSASGADLSHHSFLFGPKLTYRGSRKVNPFVHVLFGGVRAHRGISPPGPIPQAPPASETAFGIVLGGGFDYVVHDRLAIRIVQADYVLTRFAESSGIVCIQSITVPCSATQAGTQNNLRLSFGVVWRIGER